ncbi:MAG: aldehyde dehydrogenase family protein, partial [Bacteroidia bacterium]|nr:aldehyde dehydrogenase family protein [Bacteroidia bacterium]
MANAIYKTPEVKNETCLNYAPGSSEKKALKAALKKLRGQKIDIPMVINGKDVFTKNKIAMSPPHDIKHNLGTFNRGTKSHVNSAINAALNAKEKWENMDWQDRAAIFLKAADLIAGPYRAEFSAATMLCQSKNAWQAEIDSIAELVDFLRFNVKYMTEIYAQQPESSEGVWNRMEYRPLEGFVFAITPFNFTAIAGNLPATPALLGNTVVWKVADSQVYSAHFIMKMFREAGLPDGVINLVFVEGPKAGDAVFSHPDFAGLHFTGSTGVFNHLWKTIGQNVGNYKSYPRIVGETGGKDFVFAHPSANAGQVITALTRGAFEYQGQKCSAASRAYIPKSMWSEVKKGLIKDVKSLKVGPVEDFTNFVNAVIDEKAYDKIVGY